MTADTSGLLPLLRELKGPLFRDVNRELRSEAMAISQRLVPAVSESARRSRAPQAAAVAATTRAHKDRAPVVVLGKVNPKLKGFSRRGARRDGKPRANIKGRRAQLAHGVVYGPLGGRERTSARENYYKASRDSSGGALGRAMAPGGKIPREAADEYLAAFEDVLTRHGFVGPKHEWNGHG